MSFLGSERVASLLFRVKRSEVEESKRLVILSERERVLVLKNSRPFVVPSETK